MSTNFSLEFNGKYVHIIHPPGYEITPESQDKLWKELSQAFAEGPTQKRKMRSMDAFQSGSQASQSIPGLMLAIYIKGYIPDETTKFFINVAYNRGARIEFFNDKKKALQWLGIKDTD